MKRIIKSNEPDFFIEWKQIANPKSFEQLQNPEKARLRKVLLEDQGYICCYCNQRISDDYKTSIEHLLPQEYYSEKRFDFTNLLASCDSGERDEPPRMVHCNNKKGDLEIPVTPLDDNCEERFLYTSQGKILPAADGDPEAQQTIEILGLNISKLTLNRRSAVEPYLDNIDIQTLEDLEREIRILTQKVNGKYAPFCTAIISVLKNFHS